VRYGSRFSVHRTAPAGQVDETPSRLKVMLPLNVDSNAPAFQPDVHVFDSGVRVYRSHLSPVQAARYRTRNLHEPIEEEWFRRLCQGSGVFRFADVGAGIGYYAILLKRLRPSAEVFCFEPLRVHAEYLAMNLRLNHIDAASVPVAQHAVCDRTGREPFHEENFGSRLTQEYGPTSSTVDTTTLEAIVEGINGPLDLVKIDVQGDERRVIAGAGRARKQIRAWIIGTHSPDLHRECVADMRTGGFDILFEDPAPAQQPDGLVVAVLPGAGG
jgi:FkbM family methyltransferase